MGAIIFGLAFFGILLSFLLPLTIFLYIILSKMNSVQAPGTQEKKEFIKNNARRKGHV